MGCACMYYYVHWEIPEFILYINEVLKQCHVHMIYIGYSNVAPY